MVSETDESSLRHSKAELSAVLDDSLEKAKREAANALRQTERVRQLVLTALDGRQFRLRPSTILDLNRCAINGLDAYAGLWRPGAVEIGQSAHVPPGAHLVPECAEEMCDYVNENWQIRSAIHLASFVMWRLNWIHPFTDGNGRTSRAASYLVLSVRSGAWFPGLETIPEQIVANRTPYYSALESADKKILKCRFFIHDRHRTGNGRVTRLDVCKTTEKCF